MKKIPLNSKILSISHNDLDGVACQIVLGNVYKDITYVNSAFYDVDRALNSVNYNEFDYVFLTDIHPDKPESLDISEKIILIDHHPSEYHDPSKNRFVVSDKKVCAAYLTKFFVEKLYSIKLTNLDEFIKYADDYDMWKHKYKNSKKYHELFFHKYDASVFRNEFMNGRTKFKKNENEFLDELYKEFDSRYDNLKKDINIFDMEMIKACIVIEDKFINEIADRILHDEKYNYDIVVVKHPWKGRGSFRCTRDDIDLGKILSEHWEFAGGHPKAAGFFVQTEEEYIKRMMEFEQYIYDNFDDIRI